MRAAGVQREAASGEKGAELLSIITPPPPLCSAAASLLRSSYLIIVVNKLISTDGGDHQRGGGRHSPDRCDEVSSLVLEENLRLIYRGLGIYDVKGSVPA